MNNNCKFLWVNASPSFKQFHRRLLNSLAKVVEIEFWEYYQTPDESGSIDESVILLRAYLEYSNQPVHLIGHGIGGVIALSYARRYPAQIRSLTLLSVAAQPATTWHSYYYHRLRSSPYNRDRTLRSVASDLFPQTCVSHIHSLVDRLERDLLASPSSHSLFQSDFLSQGGVPMPLMVCGSREDPVITESGLYEWKSYLKSTDRMWLCPEGGHFFHHFHAEFIAYYIQQFWCQVEPALELEQSVHLEFG